MLKLVKGKGEKEKEPKSAKAGIRFIFFQPPQQHILNIQGWGVQGSARTGAHAARGCTCAHASWLRHR